MQPMHIAAAFALAVGPSQWGEGMRELPGLSLRGAGCHVELSAPDGGRICSAVATPAPQCAPLTVLVSGPDGGMIGQRFLLGSKCDAPHLSSVAFGNGAFIVERNGETFSVICDDARPCERAPYRLQIMACCGREKSIQKSRICKVPTKIVGCTGPADE